jgi:hypothetical protein
MMEEFRGLHSVVEVWRKVKGQDGPMSQELRAVLDMADEYMTEVESQVTINEEQQPEDGHSLTDGAYLPSHPVVGFDGAMDSTLVTQTDGRVEVFSPNLAPLDRAPEQVCTKPEPHPGHDWEVPNNPVQVWCPGKWSGKPPVLAPVTPEWT